MLLSFAGLAISTLAVHEAAAWADAHALARLARTALVEVTNLAAYGSLWVVQYMVLDRVLFRRTRAAVTRRGMMADMTRVLVVDDEPHIAELVGVGLRYSGFEVTHGGQRPRRPHRGAAFPSRPGGPRRDAAGPGWIRGGPPHP